jgi:hypothetical protein
MNQHFVEMLSALSAAEAEFLVVGAHARAAYGEPRATKDLDIWVRATPENAARVWDALVSFGAPISGLTRDELAQPGLVLQLGVAPYRIDIITELTALTFDQAWPNRIQANFNGALYPVIGKREYVLNKRTLGRPQDIADADHVERSPID